MTIPTAKYAIELVGVFCPVCNEAHYDKDGHDWSTASFDGGRDRNKIAGSTVTCESCGARFKLPSILARIV